MDNACQQLEEIVRVSYFFSLNVTWNEIHVSCINTWLLLPSFLLLCINSIHQSLSYLSLLHTYFSQWIVLLKGWLISAQQMYGDYTRVHESYCASIYCNTQEQNRDLSGCLLHRWMSFTQEFHIRNKVSLVTSDPPFLLLLIVPLIMTEKLGRNQKRRYACRCLQMT